MAASLKDLQELRTALGRLDAERPARQRADPGRTNYETRDDDFVRRLDLEIQSRQGKTRVLVTGQIGVGKSSELCRYYDTSKVERQIGFPVYCDLEKQEA